ncbi:hypothetical protein D9757_008049 [Collybiopsis confluens]|uniref:Uncharacterized protein n=1 Tax=Collybiopsis confluens TaxID=2823264 RepID=A0A8H5H5U1_9AGAR|nr:hypothetical protein D9757_008049 [Collybiopsis confluens]
MADGGFIEASIFFSSVSISNCKPLAVPVDIRNVQLVLSAVSLYEELRSRAELEFVFGNTEYLAHAGYHYYAFWNLNFAIAILFTIASVLADSVLVYRAYTLWDHQLRVIVAPTILLLMGLAAEIYVLAIFRKGYMLIVTDVVAGEAMLNDSSIGTLAFASSIVGTNICLTGLIGTQSQIGFLSRYEHLLMRSREQSSQSSPTWTGYEQISSFLPTRQQQTTRKTHSRFMLAVSYHARCHNWIYDGNRKRSTADGAHNSPDHGYMSDFPDRRSGPSSRRFHPRTRAFNKSCLDVVRSCRWLLLHKLL